MKKLVFMITLFALMVVVAIPVIAAMDNDMDNDSNRDYMNKVRSDYSDKIADQGMTMIYDDIMLLKKGEAHYFPLTVGRGDYEIWGVGGHGIKSLNIEVYAADGSTQSESKIEGNTPVLSFSEASSKSHKVEYEASEFEPGATEGYFLIIVVRK